MSSSDPAASGDVPPSEAKLRGTAPEKSSFESDISAPVKVDFEALARFLMEPFLDKPEELRFHVEKLAGGSRLWLRAAFNEEEDKGRVFGRGGRNIKAVRQAMMVAGKMAQVTVNLSVFGEPQPERRQSERGERSGHRHRSNSRGRGGERHSPRPSTHPAPPKKKPRP